MKIAVRMLLFLYIALSLSACVSKKKLRAVQSELELLNQDLGKCGENLGRLKNSLDAGNQKKSKIEGEMKGLQSQLELRGEQVQDLKTQLKQQNTQVGDLTVLTKTANDNITETLTQLQNKDKYIHLLQNAKNQADSINLALAVNLKGALRDGIADQDVEIKIDKTVVMINLSDKMLYRSGSSDLTPRANDVLGKIAQIINQRREFDVMVEGYTDNVPIRNSCVKDNWDLSVKRATSVVRALQENYMIDPNRLIAAGRGEYNVLASNETSDGRSMNRRTRIIIMPQLDQFYDLLDPTKVPN